MDCMVVGKDLQKIFAALFTPFNADESINEEATRKLVRYEIEQGVEGFYCCGSSGEGLLLSNDERKRFLEIVLDETRGEVPVISHVGTIRTKDVIDLANHAQSAGAKAVSMIPPYYYKFSMDEILTYYEDVINATKDLGIIVYAHKVMIALFLLLSHKYKNILLYSKNWLYITSSSFLIISFAHAFRSTDALLNLLLIFAIYFQL